MAELEGKGFEDLVFTAAIAAYLNVVKDVASKVNQKIFKYQAGKDKLDKIQAQITEKLAGDSEEACLPAIELGATNNLDGLPTLVKLADHNDQFVRACSLSAIGTLGAHDQLEEVRSV
ncbi:MAG: hypothetical protein FD174_3758 [Geobacteraceae bacterium]|nr:MAG: hypothetical protein FD174_3758 [Geobacteraceae bacterium]